MRFSVISDTLNNARTYGDSKCLIPVNGIYISLKQERVTYTHRELKDKCERSRNKTLFLEKKNNISYYFVSDECRVTCTEGGQPMSEIRVLDRST